MNAQSAPQAKVEFYAALFGARRDVYAVRWENARTSKSGWMPAVEGGWRKGRPASDVRHLPLTPEVLAAHLTEDVHIGLYPILRGDQTCWLAADFDGQAAMLDALAYLKAARAVGAPAALEVSRSGIGAHVWIFFTDPVPAATARQLGTALVREAIAIRGRMDLRCYDRLFPSQDTVLDRGLGNLIAAPLHGKSRKLGTTVFLDLSTLEPFEDQWDYLSTLERLTPKQVAKLASALREPTVGARVDRAQPARSTKTQPNPAPIVHLRLDGTVAIPGSELTPSLYATLKHAASTYNPEFYDRQRRRQSTWNVPRIITSYDETLDDHLVLPRGLHDTVTRLIEKAGSKIEVDDRRVTGDRLELSPSFELRPQQQAAVDTVLPHDLGLLVAPPGSGKTVMACAVVAQRSVPTLVLVDRKTLADQWRRQIADLLGHKPGQLGGGRSKLTGVVDIATLQTLARRTDLADKLSAYGQVIVDECHHVPAAAFEIAVRAIPARYWVGLTATPYRRDGLDDLIGFQLGPVRHTLTHADPDTLEGASAERPRPVLIVHPTAFQLDDPVDFSVPGRDRRRSPRLGRKRSAQRADPHRHHRSARERPTLPRPRATHGSRGPSRGSTRGPRTRSGRPQGRHGSQAARRCQRTARTLRRRTAASGRCHRALRRRRLRLPSTRHPVPRRAGLFQGPTRPVRRPGSARPPRQGDRRGPRLPRRRGPRARRSTHQTSTRIHQPRIPRSSKTGVTRGNHGRRVMQRSDTNFPGNGV
ncbi:MAG: DEAD/DEAH box helicase family protein [Aeromicrobium sp.]